MSLSGLLMTQLLILTISLEGPILLSLQTFPIYTLAGHIVIFDFLGGFKAILMFLWISSSLLEPFVFFYQLVVGLAQWINLKDYQALILPMVLINLALAFIPSCMTEVINLDTLKNPLLILPLTLLLPQHGL